MNDNYDREERDEFDVSDRNWIDIDCCSSCQDFWYQRTLRPKSVEMFLDIFSKI